MSGRHTKCPDYLKQENQKEVLNIYSCKDTQIFQNGGHLKMKYQFSHFFVGFQDVTIVKINILM